MSLVATVMTKEPEYCVYSSLKVDKDILPIVKAAASLEGLQVQEWASNILNEASAKVVKRQPVKRKPPRPKGE